MFSEPIAVSKWRGHPETRAVASVKEAKEHVFSVEGAIEASKG